MRNDMRLPLCAVCQHRMKQIRFCGLSRVMWTGHYLCDIRVLSDEPSDRFQCDNFIPRKKGQTSMDAWA